MPAPLTSFIGREREQASLASLLLDDEVRLVTLLGPGGVGKTRLALQVAHALDGRFRDSALFVSLAGLGAADQVAPTLARELRVLHLAELRLPETLAEALRERQLLLVLDNFEHVRDAAPLLSTLLAAAPELTILATSRVVLHVSGEHVVPLAPLALPIVKGSRTASAIADAEAVRLFVMRATAARPDFALTDENGTHVAGICRRLDGLPLALELAAARVSVLAPAALVERLDRSLSLLTGGARDQPIRLHSMANAIAWSYDLLDADQQRLFRQVSVFAGGFPFDAVEAISADDDRSEDVLEILAALVDASLVLSEQSKAEAPRYAMLETLRQFGQQQLVANGEEAAVRARHVAWCLDLVEGAWPPRAAAPASLAALARIDAEVDNIRAALAWLIAQGETELALRLSSDLAEYWCLRGDFAEGQAWFHRALSISGGEPITRAAALYGAAHIEWFLGQSVRGLMIGEQSLKLALAYGDLLDVIRARFIVGHLHVQVDSVEGGADFGSTTVELARQYGNESWIAYSLIQYGTALQSTGQLELARKAHEESLAYFIANGDQWGEMNASDGLATAMRDLNQDLDIAAELIGRCAHIGRNLGIPWSIVESALGLASLSLIVQRNERAALLLGLAEAFSRPIGLAIEFSPNHHWQSAVEASRGQIGAVSFHDAFERGSSLSVDDAIATIFETAAELSDAFKRSRQNIDAEPSLLTPREHEVLSLITRGLSNRQIADALYISRGTARTHVANILAKLEVHSRTDAAKAAERLGMMASTRSTYST